MQITNYWDEIWIWIDNVLVVISILIISINTNVSKLLGVPI